MSRESADGETVSGEYEETFARISIPAAGRDCASECPIISAC